MNDETLAWLLEHRNPGVRVRALTGLCGLPHDHPEVQEARKAVLEWLPAAHDPGWRDAKGLKLIYFPVALAECGLTRADIDITPAVDRLLSGGFEAACGEMIVLRALVMMGYQDDPRVQARVEAMNDCQLPDGGWFCAHRLKKMKRIPKSCYKDAIHALLLAAELHRAGVHPRWVEGLVQYFLKRNVFFRTAEPGQLVTGGRPGWRVIDVFFPLEVMRAGIQNLIEALAVLGAGSTPGMAEAWQILESKKDARGRIVLEGTLTNSYLPKESIGKPSKWATLYSQLAWREMGYGIP